MKDVIKKRIPVRLSLSNGLPRQFEKMVRLFLQKIHYCSLFCFSFIKEILQIDNVTVFEKEQTKTGYDLSQNSWIF